MQIEVSFQEGIMKSKKLKYIGIALIFIVCGVYYLYTQQDMSAEILQIQTAEGTDTEKESPDSGVSDIPEQETEQEHTLIVHVCGAVANPGVYTMKPEDRVYHAIEAAGGVLPQADGDRLNQAETLTDGMQLYVPFQGEEKGSPSEDKEETGVNINQASKEELMTLPGIGESKAEAIIAYRQEHGDFKQPEDLTNISGIKNGVYEKIKGQIRIR